MAKDELPATGTVNEARDVSMYCTNCGKDVAPASKFCAHCGSPIDGSHPASTPGSPRLHSPQAAGEEAKPMRLAAYLGLCFLSWLVGVFLANAYGVLLGAAYAEATAATVIGFWAGKRVLKNKGRDWAGIVALPIMNTVAGLFGSALGFALERQTGGMGLSAICSLVIAFGLSCMLFALLNRRARA